MIKAYLSSSSGLFFFCLWYADTLTASAMLLFLIGNIWQGVFPSAPLSYLAKIFVFSLKAALLIKINIDINNIFYIISSIIISFDLL